MATSKTKKAPAAATKKPAAHQQSKRTEPDIDEDELLMDDAPADLKPVKQPAKRAANKRKRPTVESEAEEETNGVEQSSDEQQEELTTTKTKASTKAPPNKRGRSSQEKDEGSNKGKSPPGDKSGEQSSGGRGKRLSKPPTDYWVMDGSKAQKSNVIEPKKAPAKVTNSKVSPAKTTHEEDLSDEQPLQKPPKKPRAKGKSQEADPLVAEDDDLKAPAPKRQRKDSTNRSKTTKKTAPAPEPEEEEVTPPAVKDVSSKAASKHTAARGRNANQTKKFVQAKESIPAAEEEEEGSSEETEPVHGLTSISQDQFDKLRSAKEDLQARYDALKTQVVDEAAARYEAYKKSAEAAQQASTELIARLKKDIHNLQSELKDSKKAHRDLEKRVEGAEAEMKAAVKRAEKAEKLNEELKEKAKEQKKRDEQEGGTDEEERSGRGKSGCKEGGKKDRSLEKEKETEKEKEREAISKEREQKYEAAKARIVKLEAEVGKWKEKAVGYKAEVEELRKEAGPLEEEVGKWKKEAQSKDAVVKEWKEKAETANQTLTQTKKQYTAIHAQLTALQESTSKSSTTPVGCDQYLSQLERRIRMYEELTGVVMQGVEDARQVIEQDDGTEVEEEIEIFKCVMKGRKGVLNYNLYIPQRTSATTEYTYVPASTRLAPAATSTKDKTSAGLAGSLGLELPDYLQDATSFPRDMTGLFFWRVCNYVQGDDDF
ncbi:hypothetical protein HK097_003416 [Rhizophlyctis rosea]|uniref:Monopolin complex subunit Csm1/Pcs1 C-terminal domain-containing protein n=1 Tax=Rhizophlyctis rosea TaxID=64517 RepID=A0AAD5X6U1_9FUNG|nr:hypothetical protein HK097_003416 [Rhizophlyctis rosea]